MIEKSVKLWLGDGPLVRVPVSQFDTAWRFVFSIIYNSVEWTIPTGATAVLNGKKPDGNVFAFSGTIADNTIAVDADVQMTAVAGQTVCELSILADGKVVGTANFTLDVEAAPKSPDDVSSDSTLPAYAEMLEMFSGDIEDEVDSWLNAHSSQIGGLTNEAKQALLTLLAHVAYTDDQGQTYLDALETALYPPVDLVSISAAFTQGSAVIYDTDSLDTLKQYLTVTALYSDSSTEVVTAYTLSGTLTEGTSTITVSYGGKTATFDVTVSTDGSTGYESVGTPTVVNNVFTPSADGYIKTKMPFSPGDAAWSIRTRLKASTVNQFQNMINSVNDENTGTKAITIQKNTGGNSYSLFLSANNTEYNIASAKTFNMTANTVYYFELAYDGNQTYTVKRSENGTSWYTALTVTSDKKVLGGGAIAFGRKTNSTEVYAGDIYLEDTKIYIDGQLWWSAV